ncbi:CHAT domain-containing protein [Mycena capillaripes]|nr:CHAT domain-containing protein [Mycena capillaripes]
MAWRNLPGWRSPPLYRLDSSLYMAEIRQAPNVRDSAEDTANKRPDRGVSSSPVGHDGLAERFTELSLQYLYQRPETSGGLDSALQNAHAAVSATPPQHPQLPWRTQLTGMCYTARYKVFQRLEDLEEAIQWKTKAVSLLTEGDPNLSGHLQNLASSLVDRYHKFGDLDDLSAALQTSERAVALTPEDNSHLPGHLQNLALLLEDRYLRFNHIADRETALQHRQRAVALTPLTDPNRPERLQSFALSLTRRYDRLQNPADLDAALDNMREAIDLTSKDDPSLARHLQALARGLDRRYQRFGKVDDLEAAMHHLELAVAATSVVSFPIFETVEMSTVPGTLGYMKREGGDLATRLASLATTFADRFRRLGKLEDLELSIQQLKRAVSLSSDHPKLPAHHLNLAASLTTRYARMGDLMDLETALEHARIARDLALTAENNSLRPEILAAYAECLLHRYDRLRNVDDIEEALEKIQTVYALDPQWPHLHNVANALVRRYTRLGNLRDIDAALDKYQMVLKLIPANHPHLDKCFYGLGYAFSCRYSRLHHPSDLESELQARLDAVAHTPKDHPNLPSCLQSLGECWATQYTSSQDPSHLDAALECKEQALKLVPTGHMLRPLILQSFARSLTKKYRVTGVQADLELVFTNFRMSFQEITPNPEKSWRAALDWAALAQELHRKEECLHAYTVAFSLLGEILWNGNNLRTHHDAAARVDIASAISNAVNACVLFGDLAARRRCQRAPTGAFTGLPLHAAAKNDEFVHSYTSTLRALIEGNERSSSVTPATFGLVGVAHTGGREQSALPGVQEEIREVTAILGLAQEHVQFKSLVDNQATAASVHSILQNCAWVHLACHAKQDQTDPLCSRLELYAGPLELGTILRSPLSGAQFVFLAGCETAMGDAVLVNEAFHLAGGFLAAGFRGAIATMWAMRDSDGPVVAKTVYKHLFADVRQPEPKEAARALQIAVKRLRDAGVSFERWVPFIHIGV